MLCKRSLFLWIFISFNIKAGYIIVPEKAGTWDLSRQRKREVLDLIGQYTFPSMVSGLYEPSLSDKERAQIDQGKYSEKETLQKKLSELHSDFSDSQVHFIPNVILDLYLLYEFFNNLLRQKSESAFIELSVPRISCVNRSQSAKDPDLYSELNMMASLSIQQDMKSIGKNQPGSNQEGLFKILLKMILEKMEIFVKENRSEIGALVPQKSVLSGVHRDHWRMNRFWDLFINSEVKDIFNKILKVEVDAHQEREVAFYRSSNAYEVKGKKFFEVPIQVDAESLDSVRPYGASYSTSVLSGALLDGFNSTGSACTLAYMLMSWNEDKETRRKGQCDEKPLKLKWNPQFVLTSQKLSFAQLRKYAKKKLFYIPPHPMGQSVFLQGEKFHPRIIRPDQFFSKRTQLYGKEFSPIVPQDYIEFYRDIQLQVLRRDSKNQEVIDGLKNREMLLKKVLKFLPSSQSKSSQ